MVVRHSARRKTALASEMRAGRLARVPSAKLPPMRRLPRGSARRRLRIALFPPLARLSNNWNVWFVARRAPAASTSGPASVACARDATRSASFSSSTGTQPDRGFGWGGALLIGPALILIVAVLNHVSSWGLSSLATLGGLATTALLLALLVRRERVFAAPLIDPS